MIYLQVFNENAELWQNGKIDLKMFRNSYPRFYTIDDVDLTPEDMNCTIDLNPYMNQSPYSVLNCTPLPRIFNLFRALGLRHLLVVNDCNQVVGVVTRKNIVKYRVWNHQGEMGLQVLRVFREV